MNLALCDESVGDIEYTADGIEVTVTCDEKLFGKLRRFIKE